jgi:hypothetical protein
MLPPSRVCARASIACMAIRHPPKFQMCGSVICGLEEEMWGPEWSVSAESPF